LSYFSWVAGTTTEFLVTCTLPDFGVYGPKTIVLFDDNNQASPATLVYTVNNPTLTSVSCPSDSRLGGYQCTLTGTSLGTKAGADAAGLEVVFGVDDVKFVVADVVSWTRLEIVFNMAPFRGIARFGFIQAVCSYLSLRLFSILTLCACPLSHRAQSFS
jgi:hypothetical protein